MSRNEEFHSGKHRKVFDSTRQGIVVSCEHCGWIGKPPSGQSQVFRSRGDANFAYDSHVAEAKGLPAPSRYDDNGRPHRKYAS